MKKHTLNHQKSKKQETADSALQQVLGAIVGDCNIDNPPVITGRAIMDRAKSMRLIATISGSSEEPGKVIGHLLLKYRGRHFIDARGRSYKIDRCDSERGRMYPCEFLTSGRGKINLRRSVHPSILVVLVGVLGLRFSD
jgi:hypothetical protein